MYEVKVHIKLSYDSEVASFQWFEIQVSQLFIYCAFPHDFSRQSLKGLPYIDFHLSMGHTLVTKSFITKYEIAIFY